MDWTQTASLISPHCSEIFLLLAPLWRFPYLAAARRIAMTRPKPFWSPFFGPPGWGAVPATFFIASGLFVMSNTAERAARLTAEGATGLATVTDLRAVRPRPGWRWGACPPVSLVCVHRRNPVLHRQARGVAPLPPLPLSLGAVVRPLPDRRLPYVRNRDRDGCRRPSRRADRHPARDPCHRGPRPTIGNPRFPRSGRG